MAPQDTHQLAATRLATVRARLEAAAVAAGRDPATIRLVAVGKTHPPSAIRTLYELGVRDFGENYAQELAVKAKDLADLPGLRLHFIGTVQSNKIPLIVGAASELQTVTSLRHAQLVAKAALAAGKVPYPVYLSVNAGGEATKSGVAMDAVVALARDVAAQCPELVVEGLMAIPPPLGSYGDDPASRAGAVPPLYRTLADLARTVGAGKLSLGMTDDLEEAIAAGSTTVRIGTALFGPRPAPAP